MSGKKSQRSCSASAHMKEHGSLAGSGKRSRLCCCCNGQAIVKSLRYVGCSRVRAKKFCVFGVMLCMDQWGGGVFNLPRSVFCCGGVSRRLCHVHTVHHAAARTFSRSAFISCLLGIVRLCGRRHEEKLRLRLLFPSPKFPAHEPQG